MRIFGECAERRARELEAAGVVGHLQARENAEALCVALVARDVRGLRAAESFARRARVRGVAAEPMLDRVLAAVAEGRIAEVVPERRRMDNGAEVRRVQPFLREAV